MRRKQEVDLVICFLKGLNGSFSNIKSQIITTDPLPLMNKVLPYCYNLKGNLVSRTKNLICQKLFCLQKVVIMVIVMTMAGGMVSTMKECSPTMVKQVMATLRDKASNNIIMGITRLHRVLRCLRTFRIMVRKFNVLSAKGAIWL